MSEHEGRQSRRAVLRSVPLALGASLLTGKVHGAEPTPRDVEGPFYPIVDNDLTFVGRLGKSPFYPGGTTGNRRAIGDVIYIHGTVTDTEGTPVEGVVVNVWQADYQGIYAHSGDARNAERDPNLQANGQAVSDELGGYRFKTIKPKSYGEGNVFRTPHIHFLVSRRGYRELVTQMYFSGEATNARDYLYNQHSPQDQQLLSVKLEPLESLDEKVASTMMEEFHEKQLVAEARHGRFDIVIDAV